MQLSHKKKQKRAVIKCSPLLLILLHAWLWHNFFIRRKKQHHLIVARHTCLLNIVSAVNISSCHRCCPRCVHGIRRSLPRSIFCQLPANHPRPACSLPARRPFLADRVASLTGAAPVAVRRSASPRSSPRRTARCTRRARPSRNTSAARPEISPPRP